MKRWTISLLLFAMVAVILSTPLLAAETADSEEVGQTGPYYGLPQVVLTGYEVIEGSLIAGQHITLQLTFLNNNATHEVRDLLVTFNAGGDSLYPAFGASNQHYIGNLAPNGSSTFEKELTIGAAASDLVSLQLRLEYLGGNGFTTVLNTATAYLPIMELNGFAAQIYLSDEARAGSAYSVSGIIGNSSAHSFRELILHLEGDIEGQQMDVELENLNDGEQRSFNVAVVYPNVGDGQFLSVYFSFTDENGTRITTDPMTYSVDVAEAVDVGLVEEYTSNGLRQLLAMIPSNLVLIVSGAGLLVLLIIFFVRRLVRRRRS